MLVAKCTALIRINFEGMALLLFRVFQSRDGGKMKSIIVSMVAAAGLMVAGSALAADMPDLAKKSSCNACHAIDKKVVGPGWMDVATKYKGDAGAAAKLDAKIAKGGSGVWGTMPMPANPKLTDAQRKELVDFILGLAK